MPSISIDTVPVEPSFEEFEGQWWLPDNETEKVAGRLTFSIPSGGKLLLNGGFSRSDDYSIELTIFGVCSGRKITVNGGRFWGIRQSAVNSNGERYFRTDEETWLCDEVVIGVHNPMGRKQTYKRFEIETERLTEWIAKVSPRNDFHPSIPGVSIELPERIQFQVPSSATISLDWKVQYSSNFFSNLITAVPRIEFNLEDALTISEFERDLLAPILFFLSLSMGATDHLRSLAVHSEIQGNWTQSAESRVLTTNWRKTRQTDRTFRVEHLIQFDELESNLGEKISTWLEVFKAKSDTLREYYSVPYSNDMYSEDSFARIVRSLESWHRESSSTLGFLETEKYEQIRHDLECGLQEGDSSIVLKRFNNAPELKQRLDELVATSTAKIGFIISHSEEFLQKVVNTRNRIAHIGNARKVFKPSELFWPEVVLKQLFISLILLEIGYCQEEVENKLERTHEWKYLASTIDWNAQPLNDSSMGFPF